MALGYTTALRNAKLDEITAAMDGGTGAAILQIYDGTRATNANTAVGAQTLLAQLTFADPSAAAAAAGVLTFNAITDDSSANASGTASWFRVSSTNDGATPLTTVFDGDVGTSGSDLNLNSTSITAGGTVSISSATITAGNA